MHGEDLKMFVKLYGQKKKHEQTAKEIDAQLDELELRLLDQFAKDSIASVRVSGKTVWVQRMLWAGAMDGNTAEAVKVMRKKGFAEFTHDALNVQGLSAFVREREEAGEPPVPEELAHVIKVTEKFNLRVRNSK